MSVAPFQSVLFIAEADESQIYVKFFHYHKCYDLIPTSAKLVVFDTQLLVKKAFFALVYNGVRAAPLWNSKEQVQNERIRVIGVNKNVLSAEIRRHVDRHRFHSHPLQVLQRRFDGNRRARGAQARNVARFDFFCLRLSDTFPLANLKDVTFADVLDDVKDLVSISPDTSLLDAIRMLLHNRIHRLPVIDEDTGNVLYTITHKRILRFLFLYVRPSTFNW